jgi:hypothetical protein
MLTNYFSVAVVAIINLTTLLNVTQQKPQTTSGGYSVRATVLQQATKIHLITIAYCAIIFTDKL